MEPAGFLINITTKVLGSSHKRKVEREVVVVVLTHSLDQPLFDALARSLLSVAYAFSHSLT